MSRQELLLKAKDNVGIKNTFVIPEYSFAFECDSELTLSNEHTEYKWLTYNEARKLLKWDSNKVAMYEINCKLQLLSSR